MPVFIAVCAPIRKIHSLYLSGVPLSSKVNVKENSKFRVDTRTVKGRSSNGDTYSGDFGDILGFPLISCFGNGTGSEKKSSL